MIVIFSEMDVADLKVRTGATKRYNDGEQHEIKRLIVHPGFKIHEYIITDDIGLIQVIYRFNQSVQ